MCGIVGYVGEQPAYSFLIRGLRKLEYRGYDSRGIAVQKDGVTSIYKTSDFKNDFPYLEGSVGIGHTRWATTGEVNDTNAHPHRYKSVSVVHNGIINNYKELKKELEELGHDFTSETDSEVIAHMIAEWNVDTTIEKLTDGFGAFLAIDDDDPDKMWAYSDGATLLVSGRYISSDINALSGYTDQASRLIPKQLLVIERGMKLKDYRETRKKLDSENPIIAFDIRTASKGRFEHHMLKEIYEQVKCLKDMSGSICPPYVQVSKLRRVIILGCGSSYYASLLLKQYLSREHGIEAIVEYASEFNYKNSESQYYIAVSQSGETKDVIEAIKHLPKHKVITFHNSPHSTITSHAQHNNDIQAGLEIGVAATKTFTATCLRMWHLTEWLKDESYRHYQPELVEGIESVLDMSDSIHALAQQIFKYNNFLILGSGYHYPIALETALKLKEVAYVHAEAMPAAEMKHGPIALIEPNMPSIVFCMSGDYHDRIMHNIEEIKARHGQVMVITNMDNIESDWVIRTPKIKEPLQPILSAVVGQLLSYHIATLRCCEIDKPRNLAKSVTV